MGERKIIEVDGLTRKFGDFTAVDHISFSMYEGEIFGFIGANGAGKTTAIKMLTGILHPSSGKAKVAGYDVKKEPNKIKKNIGYMSQRFSLYNDLTVRENITFFGGIYGLSRKEIRRKGDELIAELGLQKIEKNLVASLPLGWKQKLAFSIALIHEPRLVFLDEPTSGVDPVTRRRFWELIYKTSNDGTGIFVTTHYMDEAEYCHRVAIMVRGKIQALDTPANLKEKFHAKNMDEVFIKLAEQ